MDSFYHAIQTICVYAIPLIFAITLHESAHGWAAGRLGDPTATMLGRVTINPIPHIDPIGTIAVPGALLLMSALTGGGGLLFGWAKPVPINPRYFRNPLKAMTITAAAGPLSNLLQMIFWALLLKALAAVGFYDKFGIIHTSVGKVSFSEDQIVENAKEVLGMILKLKPAAAKGSYVKSIYLSTTMSPGLQIDSKSVEPK